MCYLIAVPHSPLDIAPITRSDPVPDGTSPTLIGSPGASGGLDDAAVCVTVICRVTSSQEKTSRLRQ